MNATVHAMPERNRSIDIWRLVCAVSALLVHARFWEDINQPFYNWIVNYVLGRYVVQFFILVSGFFFFKALRRGNNTFRTQFPRLLKIYLLWTVVYYSASFVLSVVVNRVPLSTFLVERVVFFFTQGGYPHLWFFPSLLYPMLLVALVNRLAGERGVFVLSLIGIPLYLIGALGSAYYPLFERVPLLSSLYAWAGFADLRNILFIGLPSFTLGYLLNRWERPLARLKNRTLLVALGVCVALYVAEAYVAVFHFKGLERAQAPLLVYPLVGVLLLTLLRYPMPKLAEFSEFARRQANFIYFLHPLILAVVYFGAGLFSVTLHSFVVTAIVLGVPVLAGWALIRVNRPWADTLLGLPAPRRKAVSAGQPAQPGA